MDTDDPQAMQIGVAIEVPEPYRSQLRALRRDLGDPQATQIPPHITLLPPSSVSPERWSAALTHLSEVAARHAPFEVELKGSDTFRPVTPVVFVQVVQGARQCAALESDVRTGPLGKDVEFDYHPHVTVAHHLNEAGLDHAQCEAQLFHARFECHSFQLFVWEDEGWLTYAHFDLTG